MIGGNTSRERGDRAEWRQEGISGAHAIVFVRRRHCLKPLGEPRHEVGRWLDGRQASHNHQAPSDRRVLSSTPIADVHMAQHLRHFNGGEQVIDVRNVFASELATIHRNGSLAGEQDRHSVPAGPAAVPGQRGRGARGFRAPPGPQSMLGWMIEANAFRARFSRDFTVPRLHSVISAISSYDLPSSSRSTNTCR